MKSKDLAERMDKLMIAFLMLISALRGNVKVNEKDESIAAVPIHLLDTLERIIKNL